MRFNYLALLCLSLTFSAGSVWAANEAEKAVLTPTEVAKTRTAEQISNTVCMACHAADGNSIISLNPKLAGQHEAYLVKQLTNFKSGKRANAVMNGMAAGLSEVEINALAKHFAAKTPTLAKAASNGKASLGERIYRAGIAENNTPACAACHGANGAGMPAQFPRVSGQHADYSLAQLKTFRSGERVAKMMNMISLRMTDAEMAAVADYMQGLR